MSNMYYQLALFCTLHHLERDQISHIILVGAPCENSRTRLISWEIFQALPDMLYILNIVYLTKYLLNNLKPDEMS